MKRLARWVDEQERICPGFVLGVLFFVPGPVVAVGWLIIEAVWF